MSIHKYLLDEHVNPRFKRAVHQQNPEIVVWCIGDPGAPPHETPDPDILRWCEKHGFTLITNNRASMPVHLRDHLAAGRHVPGIFILNPKMTMRQTAEELAVIWGASEPEEHLDLVHFLPIT